MDAFDLLDKIPGVRRGPGGVICLYDRLVSLKGSDRVIPMYCPQDFVLRAVFRCLSVGFAVSTRI